jgi:glutathione S-transferase
MSQFLIYSASYFPYCERAKMLLQAKGLSYTEIRVDLVHQSLFNN